MQPTRRGTIFSPRFQLDQNPGLFHALRRYETRLPLIENPIHHFQIRHDTVRASPSFWGRVSKQACICAREHPTERVENSRGCSLPLPCSIEIRILRGVTACCSLFYDIKSHRVASSLPPHLPFDKTTCFSSMVPSSPSSSASSSSSSSFATRSDKLDSRRWRSRGVRCGTRPNSWGRQRM